MARINQRRRLARGVCLANNARRRAPLPHKAPATHARALTLPIPRFRPFRRQVSHAYRHLAHENRALLVTHTRILRREAIHRDKRFFPIHLTLSWVNRALRAQGAHRHLQVCATILIHRVVARKHRRVIAAADLNQWHSIVPKLTQQAFLLLVPNVPLPYHALVRRTPTKAVVVVAVSEARLI